MMILKQEKNENEMIHWISMNEVNVHHVIIERMEEILMHVEKFILEV
jgi:hypothetical protein